jgi:hypothetical protein
LWQNMQQLPNVAMYLNGPNVSAANSTLDRNNFMNITAANG